MPVILEAVTLGSPPGKWQNGVEAVQGLNGSFLIDTEHGGMLRRPQIQADNVGRNPVAEGERALRGGAKAFVQKPWDNNSLLAIISQLIGSPDLSISPPNSAA
jgi:hypothetical protein